MTESDIVLAVLTELDRARADYGRLTDRYTDLLPFDRAVEDMLPHLQSLIDTLEGRK